MIIDSLALLVDRINSEYDIYKYIKKLRFFSLVSYWHFIVFFTNCITSVRSSIGAVLAFDTLTTRYAILSRSFFPRTSVVGPSTLGPRKDFREFESGPWLTYVQQKAKFVPHEARDLRKSVSCAQIPKHRTFFLAIAKFSYVYDRCSIFRIR